MRSIEVRERSQIAEARRTAVGMAERQGFGERDAGRVAIVATELATNLVKHGDGGELLVGSYEDCTGAGVELLALDRGRGMTNVGESMRDGHSTAGSAGTGLGAIRRGSHACDIYAAPGLGTAVLARLSTVLPDGGTGTRDHGAVCVSMPGEEACGDAWCRHSAADGVVLMVADGLGHGPDAAELESNGRG